MDVNLDCVCRFCLRHRARMWPLRALYEQHPSFLEKVYQCTQISIIDVDELRSFVCLSCYRNIERFCAFREMLQGNQNDFLERFRLEQQEVPEESDESGSDHQQVQLSFHFLSDVEDSEYDSDVPVKERRWEGSAQRLDDQQHEPDDFGFDDDWLDKNLFRDPSIPPTESDDDSAPAETIKCEVCLMRFPHRTSAGSRETIDEHFCVLR
ncbi:uncharacterized protein LOC129727864 [Wyeomyia smithii]|uniref:uncharacterized protein LOC129727864 n=1 Tax=Wyeomyia smithii TaxID=174621 RepID=UPI002467C172|nr:uncharacterized protein LOC129727864 [Wyeomyia smithii]